MSNQYQPRITYIESQAIMYSRSSHITEEVKKDCQHLLAEVAQGTDYPKIEELYQTIQISIADNIAAHC